MRLLLARALLALGEEQAVQEQLGQCIASHPACAEAYQLFAELAVHRQDFESAEVFLLEALRLDPGNPDVEERLHDILFLNQPTAAVEKLPAATVAVGCTFTPDARDTEPRPRFLAMGSDPNLTPFPTLRIQAAPAFGQFLVTTGALTSEQLDRVLAHQRATGVRIGDAAVELGFLPRQEIERAASAYHAE